MKEKRTYRLRDGDLLTRGLAIVAAARRDAVKMAEYGYSAAAIDAIDTKITALLQAPTDVELAAILKEKTRAKNALQAEAIEHVMAQLMQRVGLKYGFNSAVHARFRVSGIQNRRDGDFLLTLYQVHRKADDADFKTGMASVGLSQAHVDAIGAYATGFQERLMEQDEALRQRDSALENRVAAANALYAEVVKLAGLGKRLWVNESEAKYNDYVIYADKPAPVRQLDGQVASHGSLAPALPAIDGATVLTFRATTGQAFKAAFVAQPTAPPPAGAKVIPAGGEAVSYAAGELQYAAGERETLVLWNENAQQAGFEVRLPG